MYLLEDSSLATLGTLTAGGARIVELWMYGKQPGVQPQRLQVPPVLAGLSQLSKLVFAWLHIEGGWQRLPRQLQQLHLGECSLQQLPAELAGLSQLRSLALDRNSIQGGWQHLPRQLQQLDLTLCGLQHVLAAWQAWVS